MKSLVKVIGRNLSVSMFIYLFSWCLGRIFVGGWNDKDKGCRSKVKRGNFCSSVTWVLIATVFCLLTLLDSPYFSEVSYVPIINFMTGQSIQFYCFNYFLFLGWTMAILL